MLSVEGGTGVLGDTVTVSGFGEPPGTSIVRPLLLDAEDALFREKRLGGLPSWLLISTGGLF